jgi:hypothetical protein
VWESERPDSTGDEAGPDRAGGVQERTRARESVSDARVLLIALRGEVKPTVASLVVRDVPAPEQRAANGVIAATGMAFFNEAKGHA